jgi:DnaJ-domain-containing protein 1
MNNQNIVKKVLGIFAILIVLAILASVILASLNTARNKSLGLTPSGGLGAPSYDTGYESVTTNSKTQGLTETQVSNRKVVKNGSLTLLVKKAEETAALAANIAERMGGFVQGSNIYVGSSGTKSGSVTIRIPATRFDEAMAEMKKSAIEVQRENIDARDVTEQFVDLEARLKNLRAEEEQYQEIMTHAVTIENTLSVASHLHDVRGRIEQIDGQLQYLSHQVEMSLISISLTEEADAQVFGIRWRPLVSAKQALHSMLGVLAGSFDVLLALVIYLPVIVLWLVIALVVVVVGSRITRIVKRHYFSNIENP